MCPYRYLKSLFQRKISRHSTRSFGTPPASYTGSKILGIETSCDDTGCAVVNSDGKILGETLYSQNNIHIRYGGVNPVIAHELHRDNIEDAVAKTLDKANLTFSDIDAIAVTIKPGLVKSLKVGVRYAKFLSKKHQKPLIPIHHMEAHALLARMYHDIPFPFLVLLMSGGDCLLTIARNVNDFALLGQSLDNAPGEIMDKAARRMKLHNLPSLSTAAGGKAIELAAENAKDPTMFEFPLPLVRSRDCNFSFSGLKDSLIRKLLKKEAEHQIIGDRIIPEVFDLCAAFQLAIAEHVVNKTERAMLFSDKSGLIPHNCKNLIVSGGVACNNFIYKSLEFLGSKLGYKVHRPPPKLCMDNGVMIAWNGIEKYRMQQDIVANIDLKDIEPSACLGKSLNEEVNSSNIRFRVTRLTSLFNSPLCKKLKTKVSE